MDLWSRVRLRADPVSRQVILIINPSVDCHY